VFEHSWKLLSPKEQEVFRKLSIFVGSFNRQAAAEVAGATLPILASMVNKSLLRVMPNGRYTMHFLIHEFGVEKLKDNPDEHAQTQQGHAGYYLEFLSGNSKAILGGDQKRVLEEIESEVENIYEAWPLFFKRERLSIEKLCDGVNTICEFQSMKGRAKQGLDLFIRTLKSLNNQANVHAFVLAKLNRCISKLYRDLGNIAEAQKYAEENLQLLKNTSNPIEVCSGLRLLAEISLRQGDFIQAKNLYETELNAYESSDDMNAVNLTLNNLGFVYMQLGEYKKSEMYILEGIKIARRIEALGGLVINLHSLSTLYLITDRNVKAENTLRESLEIARSIGYVGYIPILLNELAKVSHKQNKVVETNYYLGEALRLAKKIKNDIALMNVFTTLASIKIDRNELDKVENHLVRALFIAKFIEDVSEVIPSLIEISRYLLKRGKNNLGLRIATLIINSPVVWPVFREKARELLFPNTHVSTTTTIELHPNYMTELEKLANEILSKFPKTPLQMDAK
jgi:tetratricopeptide (TPR) repeat protein